MFMQRMLIADVMIHTHMGLAIDLKKIPKTTISVNVWEFLNYDNYQILTLEELFVYKDILQPL